MKRRNAVLTAALALLVALVAFGTAAYFSGEAHVTNVITTGKVDIKLIETKKDGVTPWEPVNRVMPGRVVDKQVWVKNTGSADAWVRVKVENDAMLQPDYKLKEEGSDSPGWIKGEDGYYYYSKPLAHDESTGKLFETVNVLSTMGNEYQNKTINVKVTAQAVQVKNNGTTVLEAAGWPNWPTTAETETE